MKLGFALSLLFAIVATVAASAIGANADRMKRGLPPLAPRQPYSASRVSAAKRASPSGSPSQCNTGSIQCCNSVTKSDDPGAAGILGLLGIVLSAVEDIGLGCSPLSAVGLGGNSCSASPVCCENNSFNGLVSIGCVPINISL